MGFWYRLDESRKPKVVWWLFTFFAGLTGGSSSSSLSVRSMTSDFRLLPVRGADEASRDDSGGVLVMDRGVISVLIWDSR
jgi:hypothetical protein